MDKPFAILLWYDAFTWQTCSVQSSGFCRYTELHPIEKRSFFDNNMDANHGSWLRRYD